MVLRNASPTSSWALSNNTFTVHELGGKSEQRTLGSIAEIRAVLEGQFGLRLPMEDASLDAALGRLIG